MKKRLRIIALFLFLLVTAQPIFSQTLYAEENSAGVGVQYQYASISGQSYHGYLLGLSLKRRFDLSIAFSENSPGSSSHSSFYQVKSSTIQLTFFPTMEKKEQKSFTTELLAGVGLAQVSLNSGYVILLGAGISKTDNPQNSSGLTMRPRISAVSTFTKIGSEPNSNFRQENHGVSIAIELLVGVRVSETATLIFTPSLGYYTVERTSGLGISSSFVF